MESESSISKLKKNIIERKAVKLVALIEDNFGKSERKTLVITPGLQNWPKVTREVCALLAAPNNNWVAVPLIIKANEKETVEFVLVTKNALDCWQVWENIIALQFDNFKKGNLNPYQLWVLQHMLNVSPTLKVELEKLTNTVLPMPTIVEVLRVALEAEKAKDKSHIRVPIAVQEAIDGVTK